MPTQTRAGRSAQTARTGRFTRPSTTSTAPRRAAGRRTPPQRYGLAGGVLQRRKPPQSGVQRALGGLSGILPAAGKARSKATPSSKGGKAGGFALLTAAAGLAFKNRDKLGALTGRKDRQEIAAPASPPATTPAAPA